MRPQPNLAQYVAHMGPRLLASGSELLLDEVLQVPLLDDMTVLEFNAGAGMLTQKLDALTRDAGAELWVAEPDPTLLRFVPSKKKKPVRVCADVGELPFPDDQFDLVVGNAHFLDDKEAQRMLSHLHRTGRAGCQVLVSGFLQGSFDELFDLAAEAAEMEGDDIRLQALRRQQNALLQPEQLTQLAQKCGFTDVSVGVCERALFVAGGQALAEDPLVTELLAPLWLGSAADHPGAKRTLQNVAESIDTYFAEQSFSLRLVTGVLRAKKAAPRA